MYINISTIKRNLGFKGIEVNDIILAFPIALIFIIMLNIKGMIFYAFIFLLCAGAMLIPINLSKKNRVYKILVMIFNYAIREKNFIYKGGLKNERKETKEE